LLESRPGWAEPLSQSPSPPARLQAVRPRDSPSPLGLGRNPRARYVAQPGRFGPERRLGFARLVKMHHHDQLKFSASQRPSRPNHCTLSHRASSLRMIIARRASVRACVCVRAYAHARTCVCVRACVRACVCGCVSWCLSLCVSLVCDGVSASVRPCARARARVTVSVCPCRCVCVCVCARARVRACVCACACIYARVCDTVVWIPIQFIITTLVRDTFRSARNRPAHTINGARDEEEPRHRPSTASARPGEFPWRERARTR
jgi:hypothetical protein